LNRPGAGRWTRELQPLAKRLILAEINEKPLSICRERFRACDNIEYHLVKPQGEEFIPDTVVPDNTIDAIWSYDVFVHINATDIEKYLRDFRRLLKPGGFAIIHHAGSYPNKSRPATRSFVDGKVFARLVKKHGLILIDQNASFPHLPGDLISVFEKPKVVE
jgi:ubiquinone/menaquinone biosynthesis C-methylase UbiE